MKLKRPWPRRVANIKSDLLLAEILRYWNILPDRQLNPLTRYPRRYFSQSDEDGILEKILERIQAESGCFIELGVGDGTENNTLCLLSRNWRGVWIDYGDLKFTPPPNGRLRFLQSWITLENIGELAKQALSALGEHTIDLVSMDLDGNDYHFTKQLLESGIHPTVWIAEYNANFPPGSSWIMPYDKEHKWRSDSHFGASYTAFCRLFSDYDYFPVACSVTGANVFFVKNSFSSAFIDIPKIEAEIYQPPLYIILPKYGNDLSPKTLSHLVENS